VERTAGARDRGPRLAQVRDVVERVVETEDVDPVLRGARDEAADNVSADGPRPDEESAAKRDSERRGDASFDRTDPLPRALDATTYRRIEHSSAGDLETREPGAVEDLRDAEYLRRRELAREGLLREQADRRVDQLRHSRGTLARCRAGRGQALLM
jgi:hypothetical protein